MVGMACTHFWVCGTRAAKKKKENLKLVDAIMGQPKAHCFLKDRSEFSEYTKDKKKKVAAF